MADPRRFAVGSARGELGGASPPRRDRGDARRGDLGRLAPAGDHLLQVEAQRELGAVAVHLVELGAAAGELLERGLGATACGAAAGADVDAGEFATALALYMAPEQASRPQRRGGRR
ncbi:hypothetical protein WME94_16650 [Sorangium sp. So ce429]